MDVRRQPMTDPIMEDKSWPKRNPLRTIISGRCPRCGEGHLFGDFLKVADICGVRRLSYAFADPADGHAFFRDLLRRRPCVTFALVLQILADPSY